MYNQKDGMGAFCMFTMLDDCKIGSLPGVGLTFESLQRLNLQVWKFTKTKLTSVYSS